MKIGTLLTAAIVSLSAVGGGLAVYVAASKYRTMDKVSVAQSRLEVVRAVGDIPRYMNSERGFATNILYGPPAVDPAVRKELNEKLRKNTDGARDKMNAIRKSLSGGLDDAAAIGTGIDELNLKFNALREAMDKAIDGPAEARKDAARKIVADNAVFNAAVTKLLDEQVRRMAQLDGDAYRQAVYANIAWNLRDVGGYNASIHKNLVGAKRAATEAEKMEYSRSQGRADQILMSLQELRGNPATPANVAAALEKMNEAYVGRFGNELKLVKDGAASGKYEHNVDFFYAESQKGLGAVVDLRNAFYDNAGQILGANYSSARFSFFIALAVLIAVATASAGLIVMVRRSVCTPIIDLTATMTRLAGGDVAGEISGAGRGDEIGAMAAAVGVFKDSMIEAERLAAEKAAESDGKMRRAAGARRTHPRVRSQGHRTRWRAVVGVVHHGRHCAVDVIDRHPDQPSGRHRRGRFGTDFRQRADGGERHRGTGLLDLGNRPPGRAIDRNRRPRGRTMRGAPATVPARSLTARRRSATL